MLKEIITKWLGEEEKDEEEFSAKLMEKQVGYSYTKAYNQALQDLKSRIPELEEMILKEIMGTILKSFEELNQSDYPMAIIHWSKKDREEWIINTLKGVK